jgi:hypothetical protein
MAAILDKVFVGLERVSSAEIHRRAVAEDAPTDVVRALDALPEGEYSQDEVLDAVGLLDAEPGQGVPAGELTDDDLLRELGELHRTRNDTFRHGSDQALSRHDERQTELEAEYLRRFPDREIDPDRLREGARARG